MLVHIHIHVRFQVHLQSAGQPASQLGSQPGQSTFSIDVARLRTHIADSWTKQSPVSNSVRHSLTESCLPFISICQSGQQTAGCGSKNSSSSCQLEFLSCSLLLPLLLPPASVADTVLLAFYCILFLMRCFICNIVCLVEGRGAGSRVRQRRWDWNFFDARSCTDSLGPLKPLRFQFISSIFSFQIHIFLTKVLRFLRDFCLFVIPSLFLFLSVSHTLSLSAADCQNEWGGGGGAGVGYENFSFSGSNEAEKNVYKGNRQV